MEKETKLGFEIILKEKNTKIKELEERIKYLEDCLQKKEARQKLINDSREYIEKIDKFDKSEFLSSSIYSRLKPYLSNKLIESLNSEAIIVSFVGSNYLLNHFPIKILEEVAELEINWELI